MKQDPPPATNDTEEQESAIKDDGGNVAVLASAGSGKTRTLVQRILKEVIQLKTPPSKLIAFTFTNRAADDLKARVHLKLATKVGDAEFAKMYVGTIHGYCNQYKTTGLLLQL
jgi:DNA helicase-2/ATP-dependent DNA helicase PcrA